MESSIGLAAAFTAGFISFFAPCAVVLVPAFLLHLAGVGQGEGVGRRRVLFLHTLGFVLGFSLVFILLGASLGLLSKLVQGHQTWLIRIGGGLIIILGFWQLGLIPLPFLDRERGWRLPAPKRLKYLGTVLVGSSFAVVWSPCVGSVLGAILVLAGVSASAKEGALLLSAYSLGLMLPFFLTGLFIGGASRFLPKLTRFLVAFRWVTGLLLITLGVLVFTNRFTQLVGYLFFLGR